MRRTPSAIITGSYIASFKIVRYDRHFGVKASMFYYQRPRLKLEGIRKKYAICQNTLLQHTSHPSIYPPMDASIHQQTHLRIKAHV